MRRSHKLKRVSWAPDDNLCRIRLFLSEESPSQVNLCAQDCLEVKDPWSSQPLGTSSDDSAPPGFGLQPTNRLLASVSEIPLIKWACPPRLVLNSDWQVVAGEESREAEIQNEREMRELEAVYPRSSVVPENPIFCSDMEEESHSEDHQAVLIPITPIEEEDATEMPDFVPGFQPLPCSNATDPCMQKQQTSPHPPAEVLPGIDPNVVAAAMAVASNGTMGDGLMSHELLIKILSNPHLVESLMVPNPTQPSLSSSMAALVSATGPAALLQPSPFASVSRPPQLMNVGYYKNLIQQHGGERQFRAHGAPRLTAVGSDGGGGSNYGDLKVKIMKPCAYFNSSRGCRNGAKCMFRHEPIHDVQSAKRVKIESTSYSL